MSSVYDILTALKEELETITVANGYDTDVAEVKMGIQGFEDMVNKPAIAFTDYKDELLEQYTGKDQLRVLRIYLWCYCDTDGYSNYVYLHNLIEDVWDFLYDNFTYKDSTIVGNVDLYKGGISDPVAIAKMEIEIKYTI